MPETIQIPTTVYCQSRHEHAIEARFAIDDRLVVRNGEHSLNVDYADVFDVRVGPPPTAAAGTLSGTVLTVAYDSGGDREVLFVKAEEETLSTVAGLLYRRLLNDTEVVVSHPAAIGGRVTDKSFEIGTVLVGPGQVGCRGIDRPFSIDLDSIVDFSRTSEELIGEQRAVIDITYVKKGIAVSLKCSISASRKQHLLGRFLRWEYDDVRSQLGGLDLPDPARHALVTLYSRRGKAPLDSLLPNSGTSVDTIARGLQKAELVEVNGDEVALTSRGWILVSEYGGAEDL